MADFVSAQYKNNLKRFKKSIKGKFKEKPFTQSALIVGGSHVKIDGNYYNAQVSSANAGSTVAVTNVGRLSAAIYSTGDSGTVVASSSSSVSTGGGGSGTDESLLVFRDGRNSITGNIAVNPNITIDGVDISVHAADPDAHHLRLHGITSALDHTVTGSALDIVGLSATNTLGILTPSSAPGATSKILKSDTSGFLTLPKLTATTKITAPLIDTASDDLTLSPASGTVTINSNATASGTVQGATIIGTTKLRSPLIDTATGDLSIVPAGGDVNVTGNVSASVSITTPLITTATGDLTLAPLDDIMLDPASNLVKITSGVSLQSDNYTSQLTGWRATYDGQADFRYLFVDEMHAKSFIADLEQALAGGQIITKSVTLLYSTFTAPVAGGTTTLTVRDLPSATGMAVFVNGDFIRLRKFSRAGGSLDISDCWGTVVLDTSYGTSGFDSATKSQRYTFTRSANPNAGAMTAGTTVLEDAIVLDYGTSGNGYYEVNAIDGLYGANSPYAQIVTWTTHPKNVTLRSRLGNLYGIWSVTNEYGLYAGNGVTDNDSYLRISNNAVRLNNVPLQLYSSGTQKVNIDANGTNVWIGTDSANKKLSWDGSTLNVVGQITITGGSGIGSLSDAGALAVADDLDDVPNGSTYFRTTANQVTGAGRAYTAINSSNNLVTSVIPASAITPSGAGLYLGSNYMGYYDSSVWKTYIASNGDFKMAGSSGSNYLQWDASANKLQGVGGSVEQWYADASDGKLYAGAGNVWMDASGINLLVELADTSPSYMNFRNSADDIVGAVGYFDTAGPTPASTDGMIFYAESGHKFRFLNANSVEFNQTIDVTGSITVSGTVDGVDIAAFKSAYDSHNHSGVYLPLSGGALTGTLTARAITFSADNTYDIGASDKRVQDLYVVNLHADNIIGEPSESHSHDSVYVNVDGDTMTDQLTLAFDNYQMLVLDRTDNANVDSTFYVGVSYLTGVSDDFAFFGKSNGLQVYNDGSVKVDGYTVWHSNNDGSGSGLDADTVDGINGASLVQTSRTVTAGSGLTGGGALSSNITISHEDTSSQASVNNSGSTFIQDVTLDAYGHVTALVSTDASTALSGVFVPVARTVTAGAGLTGGGALSANITISHSDTSSQASVNNSSYNFIQDVTLDDYGHVTALVSADASAMLTGYLKADGTVTGATSQVQTFTNGTAVGSGSAAAPTYTFSGDTDTGMYRVGANRFAFAAGGTFVGEFLNDALGNHFRVYGTGSTSITYAQMIISDSNQFLSTIVNSAGGYSAIQSWKSGVGYNYPLALQYYGGNVGIGLVDPAYKLEVNGDTWIEDELYAAPNTNTTHELGRAKVGYAAATDSATFSHYDYNTSTNFALAQYNTGATVLNAPTGQQIGLAINAVDTLSINADHVLPRGNMQVALGDYNRKFSEVHSFELIIDNLVASNVMATIGGRILVAPTIYLNAALAVDSGTVISDYSSLAAGDWCYMAALIDGVPQAEYVRIHSGPSGVGPYTYSVERAANSSNTTTLKNAMTNVATTIDLISGSFSPDDVIQLADYANSKLEIMTITSTGTVITGGYRFNVTRPVTKFAWSAAHGVKRLTKAWEEGNAIVSTGNAVGDGYIELTSTETLMAQYGPTISITSRSDADVWNGIKELIALGNLRSRVDYGSSDKYGMIIGNDTALTPTSGFKGITADATDGIRLFNVDFKSYNSTVPTAAISTTGNLQLGTNISDIATTTFEVNTGTGVVRLGPYASDKGHLRWDGTNLDFNIYTSTFIRLASTGSATFEGVINLGDDGGIYQGSGTFASPTTGLKIWKDGGLGTGRIAAYNAGTVQWYAGSDGRLYAGAGAVKLDASGITVTATNDKFTVDTSGNIKAGTNVSSAATTSLDFVASTGATRLGTLAASKSNLYFDGTDLNLRVNTTNVAVIGSGGTMIIGRTGSNSPNLYFDGSNLNLRTNTTNVITLASTGAATFEGAISFGTNGGIYQGSSGTFSSPGTGLKIWRDSSVGRIAGYNTGTAQWYADTDGRLYAGGGNTMIDVSGLHIANSGSSRGLRLYQQDTYTDTYKVGELWALSDLTPRVYLAAGRSTSVGDATTTSGVLALTAYSTSSDISITLDAPSAVISISGDIDINDNDIYDVGSIAIGTSSTSHLLEVAGSLGSVQVETQGAVMNFTRGGANYIKASTSSGTMSIITNALSNSIANSSIYCDASQQVGIKGATPSYALDVNGSAHASSFPTSSDARFKENLRPITDTLDKLSALTAYNFTWTQNYAAYDQFCDKAGNPVWQLGFLAQDVAEQFPEVITRWQHNGRDGVVTKDAYSVDYARMVPLLAVAIGEARHEARTEAEVLRQRVAELESKIKVMEARLN